MRAVGLALALVGCASDPPVDAWHGSIRVDATTRADGACDAPAGESSPAMPYLFLAVIRGLPDSASLYWCEEFESCGAPFSNVLLTELTVDRLAGEVGVADVEADLCLIRWDDVTATQSGDQVEVVFRTGSTSFPGTPAQGCVDLVESAIGDACDAVLTISGTRVE